MDNVTVDGTISANKITANTLDVASKATAGSIGRVVGAEGAHVMSNTTVASGAGTASYTIFNSSVSFASPELLGGNPIAITVPQTPTSVAIPFIAVLSVAPGGTAVHLGDSNSEYPGEFPVLTVINNFGQLVFTRQAANIAQSSLTGVTIAIGNHSSNTYTSAGAINSSPFATTGSIAAGTLVTSANATFFSNAVQAMPITVGHKFNITTSTSGQVTHYVYPWGGTGGIVSPNLKYVITINGLLR